MTYRLASFFRPVHSLLVVLPGALALAACELPAKVGDLDELEESGTTGDTDEPEATSSTSGKPEMTSSTSGPEMTSSTGAPDMTSSTTGPEMTSTSTSGPDMTSSTSTTGLDATGGSSCDFLDQETCEAEPDCMVYHGTAHDFPGCPLGGTYFGCGMAMDCDASLVTICRDGTDEVYSNSSGCIPPGFTPCDVPDTGPCDGTGECETYDEVQCADDNDFCEPIYGWPHIEQDGEQCVSEGAVFFVCATIDGACPPVAPTLCPPDALDERYDFSSGCTPPGFVECGGQGTPPCP